jgi:hypothetical protein
MRLKRRFISGALIVFLLVMMAAAISFAGRAGRAANVDAQLGIRYLTPLPQQMKAGQSVEAVVIDPGKLAQYGFNVKRGDKVTLVQGEKQGQFRVIYSGRGVSFAVGEKGSVTSQK